MVAHIVQTGHLLIPVAATAAKSSSAAKVIPVVILVGLLFLFTRYRPGSRRRPGDGSGSPPMRRPRSAREAMRQPAPSHRESDTDPASRSEHTQSE